MTAPLRDCIRCDFCAEVCPEQLQPQQLYAFSRFQQHDQVKVFDLSSCTECGACESVCPSELPLVEIFRQEKLALAAQARADAEAAQWQQRFERHQLRIHHDAISQQERKLQKLAAKTRALAEGKPVSRGNRSSQDSDAPVAGKTPAQIKAEIAAAVARTRSRKAALQAASKPANPGQNLDRNPERKENDKS